MGDEEKKIKWVFMDTLPLRLASTPTATTGTLLATVQNKSCPSTHWLRRNTLTVRLFFLKRRTEPGGKPAGPAHAKKIIPGLGEELTLHRREGTRPYTCGYPPRFTPPHGGWCRTQAGPDAGHTHTLGSNASQSKM